MVRLTNILKTLTPIFIGISIFLLASCDTTEEQAEEPKISEGVLTFDVTYPYYQDGFMASLLPDEMTMTFKNNVYKNFVTKGGMFSTTLISDCNNNTLTLMLDFGQKKIYCELDQALTDTMMLEFPTPDILEINDPDSIAGMRYDKKLAIFDHLADGYDVELMESFDIDIKNSNWCNQYKDIEGVLLGYEVEQYGLQMRMRASKIDTVSVADTEFDVPENFKEVTLEKMMYELEEIFKSLAM